LLRDSEGDINMRSSLLHMAGDAAASLGVVAAGAIILVTGRFYWLDPLVAMTIGVLISWQAWKLGHEALHVLLEGSPRDVDVSDVRQHILETEGVQSVHDLHVWSMTSGMPMMSAHVVLQPGASFGQVLEALHTCLDQHFEVEHCTIQLEATDRSDVERVKH
jgi:cobalt-zinc-cadmium efflux system protein